MLTGVNTELAPGVPGSQDSNALAPYSGKIWKRSEKDDHREMPLNVAILTPSEGLSGSIARMLNKQPDIHASVVAPENDVAINQLRRADVAILHHRLPTDLTFRVLRTIRYLPGRTRTVITGAPKAVDTITRYLENGATAYTLEDESQSQLVDVVRNAGAGEARLDPWLAPRVVERYRELRRRMSASRQSGGFHTDRDDGPD